MNRGHSKKQGAAVFACAAWFALAFGLLEGPGLLFFSARAHLQSVLGQHGVSVDMLWFAPLFDLALFLVVALTLWAALRLLRRLPEWDTGFVVFSFLAFLGLLMLPLVLHKVAALSLAAGMTIALARWAYPRRSEVAQFLRKTLPGLAILYVVVAAGAIGGKHWLEAEAIRSLPEPPEGPNVLLIVADTLRADRMSVYGYSRPTTPGLEKFAAEGVAFTSAFSTSSWTLPAHASLFTGLYPDEHGAFTSRLDARHTTLASVLRRRGYLTGAFVANDRFCHRGTGLARGFIRFEDFFGSLTDAVSRTVYGSRLVGRIAVRLGHYGDPGRKSASQVQADFLRWLDAHPGRRFFAFLNFMDVHDPYFPPLEYVQRFSSQPETILNRIPVMQETYEPGKTTVEQMNLERDAYDAAVAHLDASLTVLLSELKNRGVLDQTLVVVTSDHGEALFEHGLFGHEKALYREVLHIPMLLRLPGRIPAGIRDDRMASLADLPATISAVLGDDRDWSGQNLLADSSVKAPAVFAELQPNPWGRKHWPNHNGGLKAVITPRWHFILHEKGGMELFDWKRDPAELHNVAETAEGAPVAAALREQLKSREGFQWTRRIPPEVLTDGRTNPR